MILVLFSTIALTFSGFPFSFWGLTAGSSKTARYHRYGVPVSYRYGFGTGHGLASGGTWHGM